MRDEAPAELLHLFEKDDIRARQPVLLEEVGRCGQGGNGPVPIK
ncbi:hypothetical protein ACVILK_003234 [Bradyrhizobium embrapense]